MDYFNTATKPAPQAAPAKAKAHPSLTYADFLAIAKKDNLPEQTETILRSIAETGDEFEQRKALLTLISGLLSEHGGPYAPLREMLLFYGCISSDFPEWKRRGNATSRKSDAFASHEAVLLQAAWNLPIDVLKQLAEEGAEGLGPGYDDAQDGSSVMQFSIDDEGETSGELITPEQARRINRRIEWQARNPGRILTPAILAELNSRSG